MKRRLRRRNIPELSGWRAILAGVGLAALSILITSALATLVCYMTKDPLALTDIASLVALLLGGALSGFVLPRLCRDRSILPSLLSSLILPVLLLLFGLLLSGGELSPRIPLGYLCYFGVSAIASLASKRIAG